MAKYFKFSCAHVHNHPKETIFTKQELVQGGLSRETIHKQGAELFTLFDDEKKNAIILSMGCLTPVELSCETPEERVLQAASRASGIVYGLNYNHSSNTRSHNSVDNAEPTKVSETPKSSTNWTGWSKPTADMEKATQDDLIDLMNLIFTSDEDFRRFVFRRFLYAETKGIGYKTTANEALKVLFATVSTPMIAANLKMHLQSGSRY